MLRNHYLAVKKLWPTARLLATDTDGATYQVFTKGDPILDMAPANAQEGRYPCFFDLAKELVEKKDGDLAALSHLPADQLQLAKQKAGKLGSFGLEYFFIWVEEFSDTLQSAVRLAGDGRHGQAEDQGRA